MNIDKLYRKYIKAEKTCCNINSYERYTHIKNMFKEELLKSKAVDLVGIPFEVIKEVIN